MSVEFDGHLIEHPGFERSLTWPTDQAPEGGAAASLVADVLSAFRPLLRPFAVEVVLRAYRREPYEPVRLAQPFWFFMTSGREDELGVWCTSDKFHRRSVDALTPAAVEALINEAGEAQKLDTAHAWTWQEIRIHSVEVRLPNALSQRDVLLLETTAGDIGITIVHRDDGVWISGLDCRTDLQPFELSISQEVPTLDITTCWSLWMPGGPGESDFDAVVNSLVARGWHA